MNNKKSWFSRLFSNDQETTTEAQQDSEQFNQAIDQPVETEQTTNQESNNELEEEITEQAEIIAEKETPLEETKEIEKAPVEEKKGFFSSFVDGLKKTSSNIGIGLKSVFVGKQINKELFDELEEKLLIADLGINTTDRLIKKLTDQAKISELTDAEALYNHLKNNLDNILQDVEQPLDLDAHKPFLILMVGVNGVGKTTTIGKLAHKFQQQGKSVMLAAGDTFRAAAVEQLLEWGRRNDVRVINQKIGSDSASVIYDAYLSAQSSNTDILLADTAGRLQNKDNLIEELKKIVRVIKKVNPDAPHEIMIVIDASTGQNAISQVKAFNDAIGLTGISITKLDGTAKGGVIFSIADQFKIPIRYVGLGEKANDLKEFKSKEFVDALFSDNY